MLILTSIISKYTIEDPCYWDLKTLWDSFLVCLFFFKKILFYFKTDMEVNEQIQIKRQKEIALISVCTVDETTFANQEK